MTAYTLFLCLRICAQFRLNADREFGRFGVGANTQELDNYVTFDLRGQYRVTEQWSLRARAENLLDRDYETAAFFNQPGRSLFVTLAFQP